MMAGWGCISGEAVIHSRGGIVIWHLVPQGMGQTYGRCVRPAQCRPVVGGVIRPGHSPLVLIGTTNPLKTTCERGTRVNVLRASCYKMNGYNAHTLRRGMKPPGIVQGTDHQLKARNGVQPLRGPCPMSCGTRTTRQQSRRQSRHSILKPIHWIYV